MSEVLTEVEAAGYLKLSPLTLRSWRSRGRGPAYFLVGRAVRYGKEDLDSWMESNRVEPKQVVKAGNGGCRG